MLQRHHDDVKWEFEVIRYATMGCASLASPVSSVRRRLTIGDVFDLPPRSLR